MKTGRELSMLQEVISWFGGNPKERRAIQINHLGKTICSYSTISKKTDCIGCAIGMYLPNKTAKIFDTLNISSIEAIINDKSVNKMLPEWMKEMDTSFLMRVQKLHDENYYWDLEKNEGLSAVGVMNVKHICDLENIPFNKIELNKFYKK